MKTIKTPVLDIRDIRDAGSVEAALAKWCDESDLVSGGVIGPAFSTSGPGPGWSKNHDESDYASRAFEGGAVAYLDVQDGRWIEAEPVQEADVDEDTLRDIAGCAYAEGDWSHGSVVRIEVPEIEDAIQYPEIAAMMAQSVADHHSPKSDGAAWRKLVEAIRTAAEAMEDVEVDNLVD